MKDASRTRIEAAGVFLRRPTPEGWRWLLLRSSGHGDWGFPKGHLESGETVLEGARRECLEETGIVLLAIDGLPIVLRYRLEDGRSKRVRYFPAVTIQAEVTLSREHRAYRWVDLEQALALIPHQTLRQCFADHARQVPPCST